MIAGAVAVLARRGVVVAAIVRNNRWLVAFFLYSLLAVLWSDFPFIAFKRWVKTLGHPLMALIILTDPNPTQALLTALKRCGYLLLPGLILFIKYFPQYGRAFDWWTGQAYNIGVGLDKNNLGYLCMVFGLFYCWNLFTERRVHGARAGGGDLALNLGFLGMVGWLLSMANSATSLVTFLVGAGIMALVGAGIASRRAIGCVVVVLALLAVAAELGFGVSASIIE